MWMKVFPMSMLRRVQVGRMVSHTDRNRKLFVWTVLHTVHTFSFFFCPENVDKNSLTWPHLHNVDSGVAIDWKSMFPDVQKIPELRHKDSLIIPHSACLHCSNMVVYCDKTTLGECKMFILVNNRLAEALHILWFISGLPSSLLSYFHCLYEEWDKPHKITDNRKLQKTCWISEKTAAISGGNQLSFLTGILRDHVSEFNLTYLHILTMKNKK